MWSGLKAAFALGGREGNTRLLMLNLFSVSGGGMLSIRRGENNNNAVVRI